MTGAELRRDVVILACAISAGVHAALAPTHFEEGVGAGAGFVAATALLAASAIWMTVRPASALVLKGTVVVLAGLLVSYALANTTGVPLLHPEPEPLDGLALATKVIEAVGLLAATNLTRRPSVALIHNLKGTWTT